VFIDITKFSRDKEGSAKLAEEVKKATGGPGAAAVVVCTASNAAYGQGLDFLKFNGTMVAVGIPEGDVQPIANADPAKFIVQQLSVVGSAVGNRKEAIETMEMAARGIVKTHFKVEKMDKLNDVFKAMDEGKLQGRVVLDLSD
jgi:propanol-preferring alcohol dehydrogenase